MGLAHDPRKDLVKRRLVAMSLLFLHPFTHEERQDVRSQQYSLSPDGGKFVGQTHFPLLPWEAPCRFGRSGGCERARPCSAVERRCGYRFLRWEVSIPTSTTLHSREDPSCTSLRCEERSSRRAIRPPTFWETLPRRPSQKRAMARAESDRGEKPGGDSAGGRNKSLRTVQSLSRLAPCRRNS